MLWVSSLSSLMHNKSTTQFQHNYSQNHWTSYRSFNMMIQMLPYFTDCTMHFFLRNIASKIQVHIILEINIKCPVFDLKFPPVLKMAIYSMPRETYLYLATLDSIGSSRAPIPWSKYLPPWPMQRTWVAGIHKLANTVSLPPCHHKPRTLCSLWCVIAVHGVREL